MAQFGLKHLGEECFTATFGLWNARKNAQRAGAMFWLLRKTKSIENISVSILNESFFHREVLRQALE